MFCGTIIDNTLTCLKIIITIKYHLHFLKEPAYKSGIVRVKFNDYPLWGNYLQFLKDYESDKNFIDYLARTNYIKGFNYESDPPRSV